MQNSFQALICVGILALFGVGQSALSAGAPAQGKSSVPDLTKGDKPDGSDDWTLGPTGARGWIYTANGRSHEARQILVTAVAKGSPADGILEKDDVIVGVEAKPFAGDARILFANAVASAESDKGAGKLNVMCWRAGRVSTADLKIPVLGSYSATAPYDCPKSRRIFELGCKSLASRMANEKTYTKGLQAIPRSLNALALLASGTKEWPPLVKREAQWAADFTTNGFPTWSYGYVMTFLGEYVMATGDQSVMPGLRRLALESAHGQSGVGTWGHNFAMPSGNLNGYGCMNQPGITLTIGMAMAREAGVHEPDVDRAIAKAAAFLRWYVNKGAIPYGDHQPWPDHEDNGKCSSAAVLYDLLGDREAVEYFSKMATAAYDERERGHTGNYFNILWALPGVARCGPLATGAYLHEQAWYYDFARGWDASWVYQGSPVGAEEHHKYTGWDCSGSYLLAYALPLKSLRLTGKKPFSSPPLNATQVAAVIAAGRDFDFSHDERNYDKHTTQQLLAGLSSWSSAVRKRSAQALGRRQGDFVPTLLKMISGPSREARYGACEALGAIGPRADAAAPQLRAMLKDPDPWAESLAADALPYLGAEARKASVSDLLAMTLRANPADPRHLTQRAAAIALFAPPPGRREPQSILADSFQGVDRKLLYPAVRSILQNEDSMVRGRVRKTLDHLTDEDLVVLLPDITHAIEHLAPSNEMFADDIRLGGLDLLSRLHISEGMPLCVSVIEPERWGEQKRAKSCLESLQRYGSHAKPLVPKLQEIRAYLQKAKKGAKNDFADFDKAIAAIESSDKAPILVSLKDFKSRAAN